MRETPRGQQVNMNVKQLQSAAVAAHAAGMDWVEFWPTVAGDVGALGLDYCARGQLVHRLVALVASGDADGQRPAGDRLRGQQRPAGLPPER